MQHEALVQFQKGGVQDHSRPRITGTSDRGVHAVSLWTVEDTQVNRVMHDYAVMPKHVHLPVTEPARATAGPPRSLSQGWEMIEPRRGRLPPAQISFQLKR
jgi:hypothetical protein